MSREELIAGFIGFAIMLGMRFLDFFFPKGHHYNWSDKIEEEE